MTAGVSELELQERAGLGVADVVAGIRRRAGTVEALVGKGNNGRDAVVAASDLARRGRQTNLWLAPDHTVTPGELEALTARQITFSHIEPSGRGEVLGLRAALVSANVVLDGLLGVGAKGPMRSPLSRVTETLNEVTSEPKHPLVVSVDVPSGIDADTGEVPGLAVRADVTVTLGAVKTGLLGFPAADLVGQLVIHGIGVLDSAQQSIPSRIHITGTDRPSPPPRSAGSPQVQPWPRHDRRRIGTLRRRPISRRRGGGALGRGTRHSGQLRIPSSVSRRSSYPRRPTRSSPWSLSGTRMRRSPQLPRAVDSIDAIVIGPGLGRSEGAARFLRLFFQHRAALPSPTANSCGRRCVKSVGGLGQLAVKRWPTAWS